MQVEMKFCVLQSMMRILPNQLFCSGSHLVSLFYLLDLVWPNVWWLEWPAQWLMLDQLKDCFLASFFLACVVSSFIDFSVVKATLQSQMSIRLSVSQSQKNPKPLRIAPINHRAYWPSSLSIIKPINLWSSFATFKPFGLFLNH